MSDVVVVRLPSRIDTQGNMIVHGREGIYLPVKMWSGDLRDPSQTQLDISAYTMTFEVDGVTPIPLVVDPNDSKGLLLDVPDLKTAGILLNPGVYPPYIIRDSTGVVAVARAQGLLILDGWQTT